MSQTSIYTMSIAQLSLENILLNSKVNPVFYPKKNIIKGASHTWRSYLCSFLPLSF
ncbi:hypothetical protein HanXRQr2_Chr14g0621961 [Helianthus annuus]|uniref:Uncharacterized protein n=1 Tax=Helianthus annuus TaxID=4232 RepID=A0A9K3E570_HELAN|nr:hypothetical protein HanXRQr2_Chr14g0621961 [Helianthus annuus]